MDVVVAVLPSLGVLFLFVVAVRAMFQADRRERLAQAKVEREARNRPGESAPDHVGPDLG